VRDSAEKVFRRDRVITVEEFNTTKTCHTCGDVLQGIVDRTKNFKKGAPAGAVDRGFKHCARSTCSSFLDRDINVSEN
jgi:transposase